MRIAAASTLFSSLLSLSVMTGYNNNFAVRAETASRKMKTEKSSIRMPPYVRPEQREKSLPKMTDAPPKNLGVRGNETSDLVVPNIFDGQDAEPGEFPYFGTWFVRY